MSMIGTGQPILVDHIDLVSWYIFLSQKTLPRLLTFSLQSHSFNVTVLLLWVYLYIS